jgi:hypothetical protein
MRRDRLFSAEIEVSPEGSGYEWVSLVANPFIGSVVLAPRLAVNREIRRGSGDPGRRPGEMAKYRILIFNL